MANKLPQARSIAYRAYSLIASGFVYLMLIGIMTGLTMAVLVVVIYGGKPVGGVTLSIIFGISLLPASATLYFCRRGAKWRNAHPEQWAAERPAKNEDRPSMAVDGAANQEGANWVVTSVLTILGGSVGPANAYYFITDPSYGARLHGWLVFALPIGGWLLTGLLVSGITTAWVAGVKKEPDWPARADAAYAWWCKLGLWLVAIAIAIAVGMVAISAFSEYMSGISRGTALIAGLLIMILFALWRIGDNLPRR